MEEATYQAGAREVTLVAEPIAAAIGAGVEITRPCGNLIVDIGGGITDIAVISLGGIVVSSSVRVAGDHFNEAIIRYIRKQHNLFIGEQTAETVKMKLGAARHLSDTETMEIKGRNVTTGLPKRVFLTSSEIQEALKETAGQIVEAIHSVLEKTPPELAADIMDRGIVLAGGGAQLEGLETFISQHTGIHTVTAEDPAAVVALGTGKYVEIMAEFEGR